MRSTVPRPRAKDTQPTTYTPGVTHATMVSGTKLHRVASLDVVRGLMLIASVGVNSIVNTSGQSEHHPWDGVHLIDLIFPVFVTLTGAGIAFAYVRGISNPRRLVRRVVVLTAAGFVYGALTTASWDPATTRIFGILQLYAVVILLVCLAHIWVRTTLGWVVLVLVLAGALTLLHTVFMVQCGGMVTRECNPSLTFDLQEVWLSHTYHQGRLGHDPEGLVAIAGATLQASVGALFGHVILNARSAEDRTAVVRRLGTVVSVGLVVVAAASMLLPVILGGEPLPVMKRLWTPPFALLTGVGTGVVLLIAFLLIDHGDSDQRARRLRPMEPLLALGRNSLLVYFGSHVLNALFRQWGWVQPLTGTPLEHLFPFLSIAAWTLLAMVLNRHRLYLRA